jgi:hypothetical protein
MIRIIRNNKTKIFIPAKNKQGGDIELSSQSLYFNIRKINFNTVLKQITNYELNSGFVIFEVELNNDFFEQVYICDVYWGEKRQVIFSDMLYLETNAYGVTIMDANYYEASVSEDGIASVVENRNFNITISKTSTGVYSIQSTDDDLGNATEIEVQIFAPNINYTLDRESLNKAVVRVYDSFGQLYDFGFIITIRR